MPGARDLPVLIDCKEQQARSFDARARVGFSPSPRDHGLETIEIFEKAKGLSIVRSSETLVNILQSRERC